MEVVVGSLKPSDKTVGPVLGGKIANIKEFCDKINLETKDISGNLCRLTVLVYEDKTYEFKILGKPVSKQIKEAIGVEVGSSEPNKKKIGLISLAQIDDIAKKHLKYTNAFSLEKVRDIIIGTAKRMGVEIGN